MKNIYLFAIFLTVFALTSYIVPIAWYFHSIVFTVLIFAYITLFVYLEKLYHKMISNNLCILENKIAGWTNTIMVFLFVMIFLMFITFETGITGITPDMPYPKITMIFTFGTMLFGLPGIINLFSNP
jgi:hypothetical protein